jgi:hypothetical protein
LLEFLLQKVGHTGQVEKVCLVFKIHKNVYITSGTLFPSNIGKFSISPGDLTTFPHAMASETRIRI